MGANWRTANEALKWIPIANATEDRYGIPRDLLARLLFEESSFLPEVISGAERSVAGCVGIAQLNPVYFPNAGQNPAADIDAAGRLLWTLYWRFADWQVAVAAYNWGGGNIHHDYTKDFNKYVLMDYPPETISYVREIISDVPVRGTLIT
jgi:soluble lytic murein transglycosylase-like protein